MELVTLRMHPDMVQGFVKFMKFMTSLVRIALEDKDNSLQIIARGLQAYVKGESDKNAQRVLAYTGFSEHGGDGLRANIVTYLCRIYASKSASKRDRNNHTKCSYSGFPLQVLKTTGSVMLLISKGDRKKIQTPKQPGASKMSRTTVQQQLPSPIKEDSSALKYSSHSRANWFDKQLNRPPVM
jgi:hypothetical protein